MSNRKALPRKLEKEIYQQFGSQCPFCGERDVTTLQVHHIVAHAEVQEHHVKNLLLVCANCHQKIENEIIPAHEVYEAKFHAELRNTPADPPIEQNASNVISIGRDNNGVVANTVNISTSPRAVNKMPISGTIGSDLETRNYTKYLIDRYHGFKKADVGKGSMNYTLIYNAVKREFGAKWDNLPIEAFDRLVSYLQKRIDNTRLGKSRKLKSQKRFSTFEEHRSKSQ